MLDCSTSNERNNDEDSMNVDEIKDEVGRLADQYRAAAAGKAQVGLAFTERMAAIKVEIEPLLLKLRARGLKTCHGARVIEGKTTTKYDTKIVDALVLTLTDTQQAAFALARKSSARKGYVAVT